MYVLYIWSMKSDCSFEKWVFQSPTHPWRKWCDNVWSWTRSAAWAQDSRIVEKEVKRTISSVVSSVNDCSRKLAIRLIEPRWSCSVGKYEMMNTFLVFEIIFSTPQAVLIHVYYRQKVWIIWKAQWKHCNLTFWFAGNCLALNTNKYCDFNATAKCSVMDEKYNLQCPKLIIHNRMFRNMSFFNISPKISYSIQYIHPYIVNLWKFLSILNHSLLASRKIYDRSWYGLVISTHTLMGIWSPIRAVIKVKPC